jgi:hypothetical protein
MAIAFVQQYLRDAETEAVARTPAGATETG